MDKSYAAAYKELEDRHWWFEGRRKILRYLLNEKIEWEKQGAVLELGVGTGKNLYSIYPSQSNLTGVEPYEPFLELARQRGTVPIYKGTAEELPEEVLNQKYDLIAMFDVLEHCENDTAVIKQLYPLLRTGGMLVLTVPAYQMLWGRQDEVSHHYRRYTSGLLAHRLQEADFEVHYQTYFNSLLFPPIALFRIINRWFTNPENESSDNLGDLKYNTKFLNSLFGKIFSFEKQILKFIRIPFGVSIFMAAKKEG